MYSTIPVGKPLPTIANKRYCTRCGARLSIYNHDTLCNVCQSRRAVGKVARELAPVKISRNKPTEQDICRFNTACRAVETVFKVGSREITSQGRHTARVVRSRIALTHVLMNAKAGALSKNKIAKILDVHIQSVYYYLQKAGHLVATDPEFEQYLAHTGVLYAESIARGL